MAAAAAAANRVGVDEFTGLVSRPQQQQRKRPLLSGSERHQQQQQQEYPEEDHPHGGGEEGVKGEFAQGEGWYFTDPSLTQSSPIARKAGQLRLQRRLQQDTFRERMVESRIGNESCQSQQQQQQQHDHARWRLPLILLSCILFSSMTIVSSFSLHGTLHQAQSQWRPTCTATFAATASVTAVLEEDATLSLPALPTTSSITSSRMGTDRLTIPKPKPTLSSSHQQSWQMFLQHERHNNNNHVYKIKLRSSMVPKQHKIITISSLSLRPGMLFRKQRGGSFTATSIDNRRSKGVLGFSEDDFHNGGGISKTSAASTSSSSDSSSSSRREMALYSSSVQSNVDLNNSNNKNKPKTSIFNSRIWQSTSLPGAASVTAEAIRHGMMNPPNQQQQQGERVSDTFLWIPYGDDFDNVHALAAPAAADLSSPTWVPQGKEQLETLRVADLKRLCRQRGLPVTGRKAELQDRIWTWALERRQTQSTGSAASSTTAVPVQNVAKEKTKATDKTDTTVKAANSLAEWARTVDLEPLLHRREEIRREKLQGKKKPEQAVDPAMLATPTNPKDYLSTLRKVFSKPTVSPYSSNVQVRDMYAAAKLADQAGDRQLSKSILQQLQLAAPHDARIYRRLARLETEEGNVSAARAILQEGLRLHPENAYLWHGLGNIAPTEQNAMACWKKAIEMDPAMPHAYHALGTAEHLQGRIANAMKTLKQGISYCPTNHRLHHALGDLYRDAKMLDMATKCYRKALQYGPDVSHGFAYTALAYTAYEQGHVEACRSWLRKAVAVNNGRHANGWVALAQFEESEGNIDAARAACVAGLTLYERGLLERSRRFRPRSAAYNNNFNFNHDNNNNNNKSREPLAEDAEALCGHSSVALKERLLREVPAYRSGDRFYNVYRTWGRLEELYGTSESVDEVYRRATIAFPLEWKLSIDWAQYYAKLHMKYRARQLFADACRKAGNKHADPYRLFAEFEMSHGNYPVARKILYRGATAVSQASDGSAGNQCGLAELFHVWAVCEWHLGDLSRAEVLFDHALRMTEAGEEGSRLRSFILYSIASLEYYLGEYLLAQHCIGLCLKENLMPGGNSKIWELWADVATELGNDNLAQQCREQAILSKSEEEDDGPNSLSRLLTLPSVDGDATAGLAGKMKGTEMGQLMRRDPWYTKLFGSAGDKRSSSFFHGVKFPTLAPENRPSKRHAGSENHQEAAAVPAAETAAAAAVQTTGS